MLLPMQDFYFMQYPAAMNLAQPLMPALRVTRQSTFPNLPSFTYQAILIHMTRQELLTIYIITPQPVAVAIVLLYLQCFTTHCMPSCRPLPSLAEHPWICHARSLIKNRLSVSAMSSAGSALIRSCLFARTSSGTPANFSSCRDAARALQATAKSAGCSMRL